MPGFWYSKDLQSCYRYVNQRDADLMGFRHQDEAIGLSDHDLPCEAAESAHLFRAQDREIFRTGQTLRVLDIHRYNHNQWRTILFTVTPLRDQNQNIIGTIGQGQELDTRELVELGVLLGKIAYRPKEVSELFTSTSYTIGRPGQGPKLSPRQEEVLFLLLRGCSARLIGEALHIATRTVEWHLHMLKEKFAVLSKYELIDKAIELGYLHNIPPGLSKRALSIILREA